MTRSPLLPLLLAGLIALWVRWYYVARVHPRDCCNGTSTVQTATGSLSLIKDDSIAIGPLPDPVFTMSGNSLRVEDAKAYEGLVNFFNKSPDQALQITGFYTSSEVGGVGIYENVGMARAAAFRDLLVSRGMDAGSIRLSDKQLDSTKTYLGLDAISVEALETSGGETQSFENISFKDLVFASGSTQFSSIPAFDAYVDSLQVYILANPSKTITVTGHTDDQGGDASNLKLGKGRAESVVKYLTDKGIKGKFLTDSKGETAPLVPNDSDVNRKRNRRVNIRID
jgi:OmpA-OmpF porin, OOP family